ncbi:barstar family protein [Bradyrhizobium japonicum]|uniref:barstar family protein n=1 Tax=Bradyrhizobium japonicum TaxID=375 RepID=UPI0004192F8A|nr:hypothetical protein [Bradyrhizobium japonicum]
MHKIELDASSWKAARDFRRALKVAIGAPEWHGDILGAFLDSMFGGGMNGLEPPYVIKIANSVALAPELTQTLHEFALAIAEHDSRRHVRIGADVDIRIVIES